MTALAHSADDATQPCRPMRGPLPIRAMHGPGESGRGGPSERGVRGMTPVGLPARPDSPRRPPLTPELLAEDVRRNDFMLRVAVVLLAFLVACTEIADTSTLVHVTSGRYMARHGLLPPRTDVFAYTTEGETWTNLSWLFDLAAAGVFAAGGAAGLSIAKAVLAALTFGLMVLTTRRAAPTWWSSVCTALALLACAPQLTATPEIVTLLGSAVVLWLLHRWKQAGSTRAPWALVPALWLWCNLDPRAFLGLALVLLFASGEALDVWLGRQTGSREVKRLLPAVATVLAVSLLHPFLWNVWTSPFVLYTAEYPGFRSLIDPGFDRPLPATLLAYYPVTSPVFWRSALNPHVTAALVLLAAAAVTMVLNRRRVPASHLLIVLAFAGFAAAGAHELAVGSIVWGVLAALNGQDWYLATFRQTYSTLRRERMFSLGGRVATLLGLCVLALWTVSGRLLGPDGPRTGVGWQHRLASHIAGLDEDLRQTRSADRGFNFLPSQGDVMIWLGRQPFLDSRIALHNRGGDDSVLARHRLVRKSLVAGPSPTATAASSRWRQVFNDFNVHYVLPWLGARDPSYQTFWALTYSRDWILAHVGSMTAVFYRNDLVGVSEEDRRFLASRLVSFRVEAFRSDAEPLPPRPDWGQPPSWREQLLWLPEFRRPRAVQRAMHFDEIMRRMQLEAVWARQPRLLPEALAVAYLSLREGSRGLTLDPDASEAYHVLGDVYVVLGDIEQRPDWNSPPGRQVIADRRFLQAVGAFSQALLVAPDSPQAPDMHLTLREVYRRNGKLDLALRAADRYAEATAGLERPTTAQERLMQDNANVREALRERLHQVLTRVEIEIERSPHDRRHLIGGIVAYQQGCVLRALEEWDRVPPDALTPEEQIDLTIHRARALLEAGRPQEAYETLLDIESSARTLWLWRDLMAIASLTNGQYPEAIALWEGDIEGVQEARLTALCWLLPLASNPAGARTGGIHWNPAVQVGTLAQKLPQISEELAVTRMQIALCHLETGDVAAAEDVLRALLEESPETFMRPLAWNYLRELTDDFIDFVPPSDRIPIYKGMFAEEE